jgi:hypothetical protein
MKEDFIRLRMCTPLCTRIKDNVCCLNDSIFLKDKIAISSKFTHTLVQMRQGAKMVSHALFFFEKSAIIPLANF